MKKRIVMTNPLLKLIKEFWMPIISGLMIGTSYIPFPPWALLFCYVPLWIWIHHQLKWVDFTRETSKGSLSPRISPRLSPRISPRLSPRISPRLSPRSFKFMIWNEEIKNTTKKIFWGAWWTQFILSLIGFHWISFVSHEYGFLPWWISILILLLFSSLVHLYIPISAVLASILFQTLLSKDRDFSKGTISALPLFLMLALFLSFGEILWPSIFPWYLSYPLLWIQSPISQTADFFGFQGLSFILYILNGWLAIFWMSIRLKKKNDLKWGYLVAVIGLLMCLHFWGVQKKKDWTETKTLHLKVLVVQGNIGNLMKWLAEKGRGYTQYILNEYIQLTTSFLGTLVKEGDSPSGAPQGDLPPNKPELIKPSVDLIIWPETAVPFALNESAKNRFPSSIFFNFLNSIQTPLLTGAYSEEFEIDSQLGRKYRIYNGLFLFDSAGKISGSPYHKTYLLAYGEYTPGAQFFPILNKISPAGEGFHFGGGPSVIPFSTPDGAQKLLHIGSQICYEGLYPHFTNQLSQMGADILVNLTNDSWFGPMSEPHQHMIMTLARALEVRKPLIRATNTGISTLIEADGEMKIRSPLYEKWTHLYDLGLWPDSPPTFYSLYGFYFPFHLFSIFIFVLLYLSRSRLFFEKNQVAFSMRKEDGE